MAKYRGLLEDTPQAKNRRKLIGRSGLVAFTSLLMVGLSFVTAGAFPIAICAGLGVYASWKVGSKLGKALANSAANTRIATLEKQIKELQKEIKLLDLHEERNAKKEKGLEVGEEIAQNQVQIHDETTGQDHGKEEEKELDEVHSEIEMGESGLRSAPDLVPESGLSPDGQSAPIDGSEIRPITEKLKEGPISSRLQRATVGTKMRVAASDKNRGVKNQNRSDKKTNAKNNLEASKGEKLVLREEIKLARTNMKIKKLDPTAEVEETRAGLKTGFVGSKMQRATAGIAVRKATFKTNQAARSNANASAKQAVKNNIEAAKADAKAFREASKIAVRDKKVEKLKTLAQTNSKAAKEARRKVADNSGLQKTGGKRTSAGVGIGV